MCNCVSLLCRYFFGLSWTYTGLCVIRSTIAFPEPSLGPLMVHRTHSKVNPSWTQTSPVSLAHLHCCSFKVSLSLANSHLHLLFPLPQTLDKLLSTYPSFNIASEKPSRTLTGMMNNCSQALSQQCEQVVKHQHSLISVHAVFLIPQT